MLQTLLLLIGLATPSSALSPQIVEAAPIEIHDISLQEKAIDIATEYGISTTTFTSLITNESGWDANATSTTGDRGIMQISNFYHPEVSNTCAFDVDCAMNWGAGYIKVHGTDEWVVANCYLYAKILYEKYHHLPFPKQKDLVPNSPARPGAIAIYDYDGKPHDAFVLKVDNGDAYRFYEQGTNLEPAVPYKRWVDANHPKLKGFYYPLPPVQSQNLVGKTGS